MFTDNQLFAVARGFVPLFNTLNIASLFGGSDGKTIPLQGGMLKELEMIALPKTAFIVRECIQNSHIVALSTPEYRCDTTFWTDRRLIEMMPERPIDRDQVLPPLQSILKKMESLAGMPYLWGGNSTSFEDMLTLYPPSVDIEQLDPVIKQHWSFTGVDCSGLLYFATNGYTPRNTHELVDFGFPVNIEGKPKEEWGLKKGDLIVWQGHVVIVFDENRVIESLGGRGVTFFPLKDRIDFIEQSQQRQPKDIWPHDDPCEAKKSYVIRRFHPDVCDG